MTIKETQEAFNNEVEKLTELITPVITDYIMRNIDSAGTVKVVIANSLSMLLKAYLKKFDAPEIALNNLLLEPYLELMKRLKEKTDE